MRDTGTGIDPEVFSRTAEIFSAKRDALSPDALEALTRQIVSRMAQVRAEPGPDIDAAITEDSIAAFCDAILQPDQPATALRFVNARRNEGVSLRAVYMTYISGAARLLGARWERDALTPLDVTVGAGTLYALMRALRAESDALPGIADDSRCALFATVPGEKHGIGVTVATDMFREAGWDIDLQIGLDEAALVARAEDTQPAMIGLSLSTPERLPDLLRLVLALRIGLPGVLIGVAPAGELRDRDISAIADVDLILHDATSALETLEHRLHNRPPPA